MLLENLKVKSFVTNLNSIKSIKGGTTGTAIGTDISCPDTSFCTMDNNDCDTVTRISARCNKTTEITRGEYTCNNESLADAGCVGGMF